MVALTGQASAVVPAAIARAFWHDLDLVAARPQAASGGGQSEQPRQAGRGSPPAPEGQPAQQNPPDGQNPPADQPPATPSFRTGIDFVRVDVIASDRNGNTIADLKQTRFRGHRGRQAAERRDLQAHQARRRRDAGGRWPAAADPQRRRRSCGSRERRRAAVRGLSRRLSRQGGHEPVGARARSRGGSKRSSGRRT